MVVVTAGNDLTYGYSTPEGIKMRVKEPTLDKGEGLH